MARDPFGLKALGSTLHLRTISYSERRENLAAAIKRVNADPSLRGRPLKGLDFVTGLKGGPGVWTDGTVYNPDDGRGGGACDPRRRPRATQRLRHLPALQHRDLESYPLIKRLIPRSD